MNVASITVTSPTSFRVEGVPQDRDAEFRRVADEITGANYDRNPGAGGAYDFTMRPNIAQADARADRRPGAGDDRAPRQRAGRLRAEHLGVRRHRRPAAGAAARRRPTSPAPRKSSARPRSCSSRSSKPDRRRAQEALLTQHGGKLPDDMEVITGRREPAEAGTSYYLVRKTGADHRPGSAHRAVDARRERPARRRLLADPRRRREVRQADRREHRPAARDHPRQPRPRPSPRIEMQINDEGRISGSFTQEEVADHVADAELRRAAGRR